MARVTQTQPDATRKRLAIAESVEVRGALRPPTGRERLAVEPIEPAEQWGDEVARRRLDARARNATDRSVDRAHVVIELRYRASGKGGGRSEHNVTGDVRDFLGRLARAVGHLRASVGHTLDQSRASSRVVTIAIEFDAPPEPGGLVAGERTLAELAGDVWADVHTLTTTATVRGPRSELTRVSSDAAIAELMIICPAMLPARLRVSTDRRGACSSRCCAVYDLRRAKRPTAA